MSKQLVFVHGRSQENKDADALKREWIGAFREGLAKSQLDLPIAEADIRFPYYGDTLYDLTKDKPEEEVAEVIVRGDGANDEQQRFVRAVLQEVKKAAQITDSQLEEITNRDVVERGPLNWEWLQGVLRAIDRYVPGGSGASIAIATNDVYQYLKNPVIQSIINDGVRSAFTSGVETVVVGHSLGTVVAYNLLKREGETEGWVIPSYITLGSPLAVTEIKKSLRPIKHPPCVNKWFNAMDDRDVVALYPLTREHFNINPEIENKLDVDNHTSNRHGISGYLNDQQVAKRIYDALV